MISNAMVQFRAVSSRVIATQTPEVNARLDIRPEVLKTWFP